MADPDLLAARLKVLTLQSALDRALGHIRERDAAIEALNERLKIAIGYATRTRQELLDLRKDIETRHQQSDRQRYAQDCASRAPASADVSNVAAIFQGKGYVTTAEAAARFGITRRRMTALCVAGMVPGAQRHGHSWMVPEAFQWSRYNTGPKRAPAARIDAGAAQTGADVSCPIPRP